MKRDISNKTIKKIVILICIILSIRFSSADNMFDQESSEEVIDVNLQLGTGIWLPMGNKQILDIHPSLSVNLGLKIFKLEIREYLNIGFLNSPDKSEVIEDNVIYYTDHFKNLTVGIDLVLHIIKQNVYNSTYLIGGIGIDIIELLNKEIHGVDYSKIFLISDIGIEHKIFFPTKFTSEQISIRSFYLFLNLKYNFDFKEITYIEDSNFSGATFTLNIGIGSYSITSNFVLNHYL